MKVSEKKHRIVRGIAIFVIGLSAGLLFSVCDLDTASGTEVVSLSLENGKGVNGQVKHMGSVGVPYRYAAAHHGDGEWTFKQGVVLRLEGRGGRVVFVKVQDVCEGEACVELDISQAAFVDLGFGNGGIGKVFISCGRGGHKPVRRCIAGEDK